MKSITISLLLICIFSYSQNSDDKFIDSFNTDSCTFSTTGQNKYFILEPGYRLVLAGDDDEEQIVITVLNETKIVNEIETRIVEENESKKGETTEISKNYF